MSTANDKRRYERRMAAWTQTLRDAALSYAVADRGIRDTVDEDASNRWLDMLNAADDRLVGLYLKSTNRKGLRIKDPLAAAAYRYGRRMSFFYRPHHYSEVVRAKYKGRAVRYHADLIDAAWAEAKRMRTAAGGAA